MWPSLDRYNGAIQQPDACFADPALRASWPVRDRFGMPAPASGSFGCVYRMNTWGDQSYALKCFTREVETSERRYTEVSAYIRSHYSPYFVRCEYLPWRGIMVDGNWYPVLKMDWVEGQTLDRFLEDRLDQPAVIQKLADIWVEIMRALGERGMAHGDLQHGNVLISEANDNLEVKLVDYDGMFVPALAGEEGNESGLRDYQHPRRSGLNFNERMDHFAALVIYLSLRALAIRPELWDTYNNDDNLIFQRSDFDQPGTSPLFAELRTLPDAKMGSLLDSLSAACLNPDPGSLPPLHSLLTGAPAPAPVTPPVTPAVTPPREPTAKPNDEMPVVCLNCGVTNRAIARFCRGCGLSLPYTAIPNNAPLPFVGIPASRVKICPWCGVENQSDARWCIGCRALID